MFKYVVPFILLGAVAFLATGKKLKSLETSVASLRYKSVNITKVSFITDLEVYNPNEKQSLTIQSLKLEIIYKGTVLAQVIKTGLSIPVLPKSKSKLKEIKVEVNILSAISQALSAILKDYDKTMNVKGTIQADGINFPVNETIQLTA